MDRKPDVRFVQPVLNKDQSRVGLSPASMLGKDDPVDAALSASFNTNSPILNGAYKTLNDKAFGNE